jgi:hypothetical protein
MDFNDDGSVSEVVSLPLSCRHHHCFWFPRLLSAKMRARARSVSATLHSLSGGGGGAGGGRGGVAPAVGGQEPQVGAHLRGRRGRRGAVPPPPPAAAQRAGGLTGERAQRPPRRGGGGGTRGGGRGWGQRPRRNGTRVAGQEGEALSARGLEPGRRARIPQAPLAGRARRGALSEARGPSGRTERVCLCPHRPRRRARAGSLTARERRFMTGP